MHTSTPLVSVIMPAYNAQNYIEEAIQSLLDQSYAHWELIVIDDGSTDNTLALIRSFKDERIIVKTQENAGVSVARNVGLDCTKGEYITFLDADDVLPHQSIEYRISYLEEHSDVDVVDGYILVKNSDMSSTLRTYEPYYKGKLLPRLLALDARVFFNVCYMFRRSILGDIRFKEKMTHAEDLLFYIQLASQNDVTYGFVTESIYAYRRGHLSTMTDISGLEQGYMKLLGEIKLDKNISKISFVLMKLRIMKIMFLSWLRERQIMYALLSTYKILWI